VVGVPGDGARGGFRFLAAPNPFGSSVQLALEIPDAPAGAAEATVTARILDVAGRGVRFEGMLLRRASFDWDAAMMRNQPDRTYFAWWSPRASGAAVKLVPPLIPRPGDWGSRPRFMLLRRELQPFWTILPRQFRSIVHGPQHQNRSPSGVTSRWESTGTPRAQGLPGEEFLGCRGGRWRPRHLDFHHVVASQK
jgi:hypothetical protein